MPTEPNHLSFPTFNQDSESYESTQGLTKRELFAAMAMQGLLGSGKEIAIDRSDSWIAQTAIEQADTLIKALNE